MAHGLEQAAANVRMAMKAVTGDDMPGVDQALKDEIKTEGYKMASRHDLTPWPLLFLCNRPEMLASDTWAGW